MIKKAKQYSAHRTDRFWLKVAYLMLVLGVGILAVSAITNPDSYPFRRTGPVVEGEGVDATAESGDVGLWLEEANSQEAYGTAPLAEPEGTAQGWNLQGYDAAAGAPDSPTSPDGRAVHHSSRRRLLRRVEDGPRQDTFAREEEVLQKLIDDSNTHPDVYRRAQEALLSLGRAGAPGGGSGEHDTGTGIRTSCCLPVGSGRKRCGQVGQTWRGGGLVHRQCSIGGYRRRAAQHKHNGELGEG